MSSRPPHSLRLLACAVLVGLAWYALILGVAGRLLPEDFGRMDASWELGIPFVLAVVVPAWFFRRFLVQIRWSETFHLAVCALLLAAATRAIAEQTCIYIAGGCVEELQEPSTLFGKLACALLLVILGTMADVLAALQLFYVTLPLSWLSLIALKSAAGTTPSEEYSMRRVRAPAR